ncbi:MAG: histidinol dehydrogenase [Myxococcales bacterium]|nr:histidinol dehydrogenase [Myxococcales bacterium]MCB9706565.1 histidinol dehydrogenase [Myxococcales bacterium]
METFPGAPLVDLRGDDPGARERWRRMCQRSAGLEGEADAVARAILADVRARGDAAVIDHTERLEGRALRAEDFEIDDDARRAAAARVAPELRAALEVAAANVDAFHRTQVFRESGLQRADARLGSRVRPLGRVAVYAPGGTAAYPSSVLMAAIPARVAGVREVILFTPRPSDVVVLAAELAGVDRIFALGGAQAIAAAALGTATVPRVDKIVGPGNAYVTAAKRQVFGLCDIDGIAGPSEVLIVADEGADPELIAADLLAQAEHDPLACPIVVSDAPALVEPIQAALARQLATLPRRAIAARALVDHGAIVLVRDRAAMLAAADEYAAEHLELLIADADAAAEAITCAGAIFVGPWTPEAAGDYTAGPSHVLPTAGAARFASPLGVWDFLKYTSILRMGPEALAAEAPAIARLARAEGLEAHARAAELRFERDDAAEGER